MLCSQALEPGGAGVHSTPTFLKLSWKLFIKFPAAIKANLYIIGLLNCFNGQKLDKNGCTLSATQTINCNDISGRPNCQLVNILWRFYSISTVKQIPITLMLTTIILNFRISTGKYFFHLIYLLSRQLNYDYDCFIITHH